MIGIKFLIVKTTTSTRGKTMTEPKEIKWLREYSNGRKELKENALKNDSLPDFANFDLEFWKKIYEEGKQAVATENGIKWHDLRKDPNDLPNEEKDVLVYSGEQWRMSVCRYFPQHKAWEAGSDTIAWCEIPKCTEE